MYLPRMFQWIAPLGSLTPPCVKKKRWSSQSSV
jgi:hypothetical protein